MYSIGMIVRNDKRSKQQASLIDLYPQHMFLRIKKEKYNTVDSRYLEVQGDSLKYFKISIP